MKKLMGVLSLKKFVSINSFKSRILKEFPREKIYFHVVFNIKKLLYICCYLLLPPKWLNHKHGTIIRTKGFIKSSY